MRSERELLWNFKSHKDSYVVTRIHEEIHKYEREFVISRLAKSSKRCQR